MTSRIHIFCVPFFGAGHGVNMFNVAILLANPQVQVHVLVTSRKNALKWMKATGQDPNANVDIEVVGDGKWEDWHSEDARQLFQFLTGAELAESMGAKMAEITARNPEDKTTAIIFNGLMSRLIQIYKNQGLKGYLLAPSPYYMTRLALAVRPGDTPDTDIVYQGIGGSDKGMPAKLSDAISVFGPMGENFTKSLSSVDGLIYSNTNIGLEGDQWQQPDMAHNGKKSTADYMIGPLLPTWLEHGLDRPELLKAQKEKFSADPCIQFMNRQDPKSVVYVALGSHCGFSFEQATLIVQSLRKTNTKWILLYREDAPAMVDALGKEFDDGIVTSWAPQVEVMVHPALKCVLSHGGFGTMIEGVYAGAPFITSPVASDQFLDTRVMQHLGIGVGCIAEFTREDIMANGRLVPVFPDDGGQSIEKLFTHLFSTSEGEVELENARAASRRLRSRMVEAKAANGAQQLQTLLREIGASA